MGRTGDNEEFGILSLPVSQSPPHPIFFHGRARGTARRPVGTSGRFATRRTPDATGPAAPPSWEMLGRNIVLRRKRLRRVGLTVYESLIRGVKSSVESRDKRVTNENDNPHSNFAAENRGRTSARALLAQNDEVNTSAISQTGTGR